MFNSLTGIITGKLPQTLYLETNGIEWELLVPDSSLDRLPPVGNQAKVYTWLLHREDSMKLFGFASLEERSLFLDLLKVDGVGAKGAVKMLSGISAAEFAAVLDEGNLAKLEKLPGVGKKTAQKMMLALKGKLTFSETSGFTARKAEKENPWIDVVTALTDMGYDRRQCEEAVEKLAALIIAEHEKSGKDTSNRAAVEDELFRRAIVELAK